MFVLNPLGNSCTLDAIWKKLATYFALCSSLFRLCARPPGISPRSSGFRTDLSASSKLDPLADSRGFRVLPFERIRCCDLSRARFPHVFGPFRVLPSLPVGHSCERLPLLPFIRDTCASQPRLQRILPCRSCAQSCDRTLTLLGVPTLQGIHPAQSFSLLPADSPLSVLTALGICSPGQAGIFQLALNAAPPGISTGAFTRFVSYVSSLHRSSCNQYTKIRL